MSRLARLARRFLATAPRRPRHKLHAVRFRRLAGSVRDLVALCDDAADKLEGEWILDRSYAMALGQRVLELGRSIVFDSHVLSGDDSGRLFASLDTVRRRIESQLARGRATEVGPPDPTPGADEEEPAYRLLREVLEEAGGLAGVVAEAHEEALRSFETLRHETWGRRAGRPLRGVGLPGPVRVVDAGGGTAPPGADGWRPGLEWPAVRCPPLRALLEPLTGPSPRDWPSPERTPSALAVVTGECATVDVRWPRGVVLLDVCLSDHVEANVVYIALREEPSPGTSVLEALVAAEGFRVVPFGPGLTAWLTGRGPADTGRILARLGEALPGLWEGPARAEGGLESREASAQPVATDDGRGRA